VRRSGVALCVLAAACGAPPEDKSDWERAHERVLPQAEDELVLPAYPKEEDLVEFAVGAPGEFRFFIDAASLGFGADGVVRYTLIARSASGAENVTYEGLRCSTAEVRIYALGHGRGWVLGTGGWRVVQPGGAQRWHRALHREYFCSPRQRVTNRRDAVDSLRRKPPTEF
jgi:hypothetical protein